MRRAMRFFLTAIRLNEDVFRNSADFRVVTFQHFNSSTLPTSKSAKSLTPLSVSACFERFRLLPATQEMGGHRHIVRVNRKIL